MALNEKQRQFVQEYLVDLNATQAAKRAGYSERTAYSQGQRLLKHDEIQAAIQEARKAQQERTEITADRVLQEYARVAFFDPRKLFGVDGKPRDVTDLDQETAAALAALDVLESFEGGEFVGYVKKYRMASKLHALDALAKHLGLFEKQIQEEGGETGVVFLAPAAPEPEPPPELMARMEEEDAHG